MVDISERRQVSGWRFVLQPNRSISWRSTVVFYAILATVSLAVAAGFAALGYWLVLPFTGLELLALAIALYVVARHCWQREIVSIDSDAIRIERGRNQPSECFELSRQWARAVLEQPEHPWRPSRLLIRNNSHSVEVGRFLNEGERLELATSLARALLPPDYTKTEG